MSHDELAVLADGQRMGQLLRDRRRDTLHFHYDAAWSASPDAFPLSLSMPLAIRSHGDDVVEPFLWGLLPDNHEVLRRWGERFSVSPRHAFRLIAHVGEDCAGAVQFVAQERAEELLRAPRPGRVHWLDERGLAERIRLLLQDHSASRLGSDTGRFSLAGAQPKTALFRESADGRWGVPEGATPTTHILKPATGQFDGFAENEHFCLRLCREIGIPAAGSTVLQIDGITVFVTERYDRARVGRRVHRIHQEDLCQALGRMPHAKYQNEGGPDAKEILAVIRQWSRAPEDDAWRFLDGLLLTWILIATDAHAKNWSLLLGAGGQVRLAPLYDLASALPYREQMPPRKVTLAMKIGGKYRVADIGVRAWQKAAAELHLAEEPVRERILALTTALPGAIDRVHAELHAAGMRHRVVDALRVGLQQRAAAIGKLATDWR